MNLPNKLTILRVILVPVFMFFICFPGKDPGVVWYLLAAASFGLAAITDFFDGKIARKYNLITDFGKFLDPLADKFMIMAAVLCFCSAEAYREPAALHTALIICGAIVILRELAVTSLRLVVSTADKPVVIAASWYGKAKTMTQCIWVVVMLIEPILPVEFFAQNRPLSWVLLIAMTVLTIFSGADYMKKYWPYLDPTK